MMNVQTIYDLCSNDLKSLEIPKPFSLMHLKVISQISKMVCSIFQG